MKFIDFFAGIGGFRLGMEMAGHECVGHCEIDKYADKSYRAMHNVKEGEWFANDITRVEPGELPEADCYCGGFPCQSFSIAGKRGGFQDTRGTLFFEVMRLAQIRKPKYLFLENVAGLLSHDGGRTFGTIISTMGELGYDAEWQVLNSKHFGVPQNRERVFIIGHLGGGGGGEVFPITGTDKENCELEKSTKSIAACLTARGAGNYHSGMQLLKDENGNQPSVNDKVYDSDGISPAVTTSKFFMPNIAIPVLTPDRAEKRQNGRRFKENGEPMFTLTAQDRHGVMVKEATKQGYAIAEPGDSINLEQPNSKTRRGRVGKGVANTITTSCNQAVVEPKVAILRPKRTEYGKAIRKDYESGKIDESRHNMTKLEPVFDGVSNTITTVQKDNLLAVVEPFRIRKLTPKECWRLQGFPDWAFDRAKAAGVSDSQLYKQAGNSVTVNVVYEIARRLI